MTRTRTPRDEIWTCLENLFGATRTRSEASRRGRVISELLEAGATVAEVELTFRYCRSHFSQFTEMALCTNLGRATAQTTSMETLPQLHARLKAERGQ